MGKKLTKEEFIAKVILKNEHVRNRNVEIRGEYVNSQTLIECYCNKHDVTWNPIAASLYKGIGCRECAKEGISEKNSKTHDEFVNELASINNDIVVISRYRGMYEDITIQFQCGHIWTTRATNVYYKHIGCPYCSGQAVLVGFNDLWTTDPKISSLLTNPEDGFSVSRGSGKKKSFTCPLCHKPQNKIISNVIKRGFQCIYCGDGISYPNKFGRAFLNQVIGNSYIPEYSTDWCRPYKYDNYFNYNGNEYFLEMDGAFHYKENKMSHISLEEIQRIDAIKDKLAREHNVHLIRIDCKQSNCDYIVNKMIHSDLNALFDLSKIDWIKCDEQAQNSLVKPVCDLYLAGVLSPKEIANALNIGYASAANYLKKGTRLGWCNYDPTKTPRDPKNGKPILVLNVNTGEKFYFSSRKECELKINDMCGIHACSAQISKLCKTRRIYKGFKFEYITTTTQN